MVKKTNTKKSGATGNGPRGETKPLEEDKDVAQPSEESTTGDSPAVNEDDKGTAPPAPVETKTEETKTDPKKKMTTEERFEHLMSVVENQADTIQHLTDKINVVADKSRLNAFEEKSKENFNIKKFKLWKYKGKLVLGWSELRTDNVYKKDNKVWIEDQTTELIYADNSKEVVPYRLWQAEKVEHNVVLKSETVDAETGTRILTVEDEKGKVYKIDVVFVN